MAEILAQWGPDVTAPLMAMDGLICHINRVLVGCAATGLTQLLADLTNQPPAFPDTEL
jgi:hypothetical protein